MDNQFETLLREKTKLQGRQLLVQGPTSYSATTFVTFINLPEGVGSAAGGAEAMNNRMSFSISAANGDGKWKLEQMTSSLPRTHRLHAKTDHVEKLAAYLATFISQVVAEVEPRFTHTKTA